MATFYVVAARPAPVGTLPSCSGPTARLGVITERRSGRSAKPAAQSAHQLRARRHAELREDAVEMRLDGPVRQVQPLGDLAVRQPTRRHLHDLQFLRRKLVEGVAPALPAALP